MENLLQKIISFSDNISWGVEGVTMYRNTVKPRGFSLSPQPNTYRSVTRVTDVISVVGTPLADWTGLLFINFDILSKKPENNPQYIQN